MLLADFSDNKEPNPMICCQFCDVVIVAVQHDLLFLLRINLKLHVFYIINTIKKEQGL